MPPLHDRFFRALLRLFPREFRGDFGDQMIDDFRDLRADAIEQGRTAPLRLWLRALADVLHRAPREHCDILQRDAGYAIRIFRRRPGLTASALVTLAIGIGLNAAVFSVVHSVLWSSLPLPDSERLVHLSEIGPPPERESMRVSPGNFLDWEKQTRTLDGLATISVRSATLVRDTGAERIIGAAVTADFFRILPARVVVGRLLGDDDYAPLVAWGSDEDPKRPRGAAPPGVALISHGLWQRQFGGRPDIVGEKIQVDRDATVEIVGVLDKDFIFPLVRNADYWIPSVLDAAQRRARYVMAIGRLVPGSTIAESQAEFDVIARQLESAYPDANKDHGVRVVLLRHHLTAGVQTQLWFLAGTAFCVLLIACANVSNLLLTHTSGRHRELATRIALGASRAHLVRQALTEGVVLAAAGGIAGVLLARWAVRSLVAIAPSNIPRLDEVSVGPYVLACAAAISIAVGLACGLVATVASTSTFLRAPLRTTSTSAKSHGRAFRQGLTVAQISMALILAVAASLMVQTMRALSAVPLGFDPVNVISIGLSPDIRTFGGAARKARFEAEVIDPIRKLPGVVAAGIGSRPLSGSTFGTMFALPDEPSAEIPIDADAVGPGYLDALGARLLAGRFFTDRDGPDAPLVALVNETAATRYFPEGAVGRTIRTNRRNIVIVGVLGDVRTGLEEAPEPTLYFPSAQTLNFWTNNLLVRTRDDPRELVPAVRTVVRQVHPELPLRSIKTLEEQLSDVTAPRRFTLWLVGLFSVIALGLAAIGIYGVIAESVAQRVPEIGVRMALGATPAGIMRLVLRHGGWMVVIGTAIGLALALALNEVMSAFVFGVPTTDPLSYSTAAAALIAAGFGACAIPARRAAQIDPVVALRQE